MDTTIFFLSCLVSFFLQKFLDKHFPKGGKGTPPPPTPPQKKKKPTTTTTAGLPAWT